MTQKHVSFTYCRRRYRYAVPEGVDPKAFKNTAIIETATKGPKPVALAGTDEERRRIHLYLAQIMLNFCNKDDITHEQALISKVTGSIIMDLVAEVDSLKALLKAKQKH